MTQSNPFLARYFGGSVKKGVLSNFLQRVNKEGGENLLSSSELKQLLQENYKEYSLLGIPSSRGKVYTEVMANPEMTSATGWSAINAGVVYNSNLQRFDINYGGNNYGICIRQNVALPSRLYKVQVTFDDITSGSVRVTVGGNTMAIFRY